MVLQETNEWGERKGKGKTLTEYIVAQAKVYLSTNVDINGKTIQSRYSSKEQSRFEYLIGLSVRREMQKILKRSQDFRKKLIKKDS